MQLLWSGTVGLQNKGHSKLVFLGVMTVTRAIRATRDIRAIRAIRATRAIGAIRAIRATRAIGAIRAMRVTRAIGAISASQKNQQKR